MIINLKKSGFIPLEAKKPLTGFTLIETLLYSAIVVVIIGSMIGMSYALIRTSNRLEYQTEVNENAQFLTNKIAWVLKGATNINSPAVNTNGATLSVNTSSLSFNPFVFDLSGGAVRLKVGTAVAVPITNGHVTVSSLSFSNFSFADNSKNTIRVRALLESVDPEKSASGSIDLFITVQ